jgi:hypothetical protein
MNPDWELLKYYLWVAILLVAGGYLVARIIEKALDKLFNDDDNWPIGGLPC